MHSPNSQVLADAARNFPTPYIPLYEHAIAPEVMEALTGKKFATLIEGGMADKREFFRQHNAFQQAMGYDATILERGLPMAMPGSGALRLNAEGCIKTRADFEQYPWHEVPDRFFALFTEDYQALRDTLPPGMQAVGGVGFGLFECVQDMVGFEELCYIRADDEALYGELFRTMGNLMVEVWGRFLRQFGDMYCLLRMGDDLGFRSTTLLPAEDIRTHIVPQYRRIIQLAHDIGKPFLLHSCGQIFDVMDDFITVAGIDAKHSNEDAIAPFGDWIQRYGDRIGNFGGLDTDVLCDLSQLDIVEYTTRVYHVCAAKGHGVAIGSGNSVPDYVNPDRYYQAVETIRRLRGDTDPAPF